MRDIVEAIAFLHNMDIAHRDLKVTQKLGPVWPNCDKHWLGYRLMTQTWIVNSWCVVLWCDQIIIVVAHISGIPKLLNKILNRTLLYSYFCLNSMKIIKSYCRSMISVIRLWAQFSITFIAIVTLSPSQLKIRNGNSSKLLNAELSSVTANSTGMNSPLYTHLAKHSACKI
mgnify:CR=1 FL=1